MRLRHGQHRMLAAGRDRRKVRTKGAAVEQSEVDGTRGDVVLERTHGRFLDGQLDARVLAVKGDERIDEEAGCPRARAADRQAARAQLREVCDFLHERLLDAQDLLRLAHVDGAGRRQRKRCLAAVKETHAELRLDFLDALRERWLRDVEMLSSSRESPVFGDLQDAAPFVFINHDIILPYRPNQFNK